MVPKSMVHSRWYTVDGTQSMVVDGTQSMVHTVDGTQLMVHTVNSTHS